MIDTKYRTVFLVSILGLLVVVLYMISPVINEPPKLDLKDLKPLESRNITQIPKFIIPGTLGVATQGCNNLFLYGSMTKKFKSGKATARIITNGATIRTKAFEAYQINTKPEYDGMGFEAYFHTFNIKHGDVIDIQATIIAEDETAQHISKVFVVDEEKCDTVANKNDFKTIWGYNKF